MKAFMRVLRERLPVAITLAVGILGTQALMRFALDRDETVWWVVFWVFTVAWFVVAGWVFAREEARRKWRERQRARREAAEHRRSHREPSAPMTPPRSRQD